MREICTVDDGDIYVMWERNGSLSDPIRLFGFASRLSVIIYDLLPVRLERSCTEIGKALSERVARRYSCMKNRC